MMLNVGLVGFLIFVSFLAVSTWRAFAYAWKRHDIESLWPLAFIVFALVVNFFGEHVPVRRRHSGR